MVGAALLATLNKSSDSAGADADKKLHKLRTGNMEKRDIAFPSHRSSHQSLTASRAAHQQNPFGNSGANVQKFFGFFKNSTISVSSSLASLAPATSLKVTFSFCRPAQ